MKLTLKDSSKVAKFSDIFKHLKQLLDNIVIYFSSNGIYIQGMDMSQICLFECKLDANWFDDYCFDEDNDDNRLCVNTGILHKVVNAVDETQIIELSYEGSADILNIKFSNPKHYAIDGRFTHHFEIALIDIDSERLEIPVSDTHVDLTMDVTSFSKLVGQLIIFSDQLTLTFTDASIQFETTGIDGGMKSQIDLDDVSEYAIGEDVTLVQSYSLSFINKMCSFSKLNKHIVMGFSENMPMSLTYNLSEKECCPEGDVGDKYSTSSVAFYLAPRMED